jgi:DNA-binding response OmpR family regulator
MADGPAALLLVEDEAHVAESIVFNLVREGYRVDTVADIAGARRAWETGRHGLVILDVMLPDGSGFDLLAERRAAGSRAPVLMLTARAGTADVVRGLELGADDYLAKPFAVAELLSRIAALLRRRGWDTPAADEPARAAFGGNRVDLATGAADTGRGPAQLTEMETKLLRCFIRHRGEELSREFLLAEVWDLAVEQGARSRTLDTFVMRLRKLLEPDPAAPVHFRTVYGVGYKFLPGDGAEFSF